MLPVEFYMAAAGGAIIIGFGGVFLAIVIANKLNDVKRGN